MIQPLFLLLVIGSAIGLLIFNLAEDRRYKKEASKRQHERMAEIIAESKNHLASYGIFDDYFSIERAEWNEEKHRFDFIKEKHSRDELSYSYRYWHDKCGGIAFYSQHKIKPGDPMDSLTVRFENGEHPDLGSALVCGHCGKPLRDLDFDSMIFRD